MIKTVKDACVLHDNAIDFSMADHIENLQDLIHQQSDGLKFFEQTHITNGMEQLFRQGLMRLAGKSNDGVFQLTQAMGGGKTHLMIALGLLAKNPELREKITPELASTSSIEAAKVVAFTGRHYPDHFFWGEIAAQLGKQDQFSRYWVNGPLAPDENAWIQLMGDEPVLILLDELPPYFDNAQNISVGGGNLAKVATAALANLMSAALRLPKVCIVMSNLSGSYENASNHLNKALRDIVAETNRQARPITPVQLGGNEIYQILRKRLFKTLPSEQSIKQIAEAYASAIGEAEKAKSIAKSADQISLQIEASYPFHPGLKDVIAMFKENESFRQTRGLMRFVSRILKSVWKREDNDVYLIGAQYLDMNHPEIRDEVLNISNLQSAVSKDIADNRNAHAELIDCKLQSDAGSQVATLLMTASLAKTMDGVQGLDKQRVMEYLITPQRDPLELTHAFDELRKSAWYLHAGERGCVYFSAQENLTKRLEKEADTAPENKIEEEMRRRLLDMFEPTTKNAYETALALPKLDDINLKLGRQLLILSPDHKLPPEEAKRLFEAVPQKNNFCIITGDGSDMASLDGAVRRVWAAEKVDKMLPANHPQKDELQTKQEAAELEFHSTVRATFNRLFFPMKDGLKPAKFAISFASNSWDGEAQVERSLTDTGASKLITDVVGNADKLMLRAEELLWPQGQHRIRWADIVDRAKTNPRWLWVPPKGLEELRRIAEQQARWRYTDDGYIDKNPDKASTSVNIISDHYDPLTGIAKLRITAIDAGKHPIIYVSATPDVSPQSPVLKELTYETQAACQYYLAVDPSGEHPTGSAMAWENTLTITHQPRDQGLQRGVELKVTPGGELRFSLDGSNPREGEIYSQPFEIGRDETLVSVYAVLDGVEATKQFRIPKTGQSGPQIDPAKPAVLNKKMSYSGSDVHQQLTNCKQAKAVMQGPRINIGQGDKNVMLRFGSGILLDPKTLEELLDTIRIAMGDPQAHIGLEMTQLAFSTGHDLVEYAKKNNIKIEHTEIAQ